MQHSKQTALARTLRKHDTCAEKLVWSWLRDRRFSSYKFRRQHVLGPHILDFFCLEARLDIELDGSQHGFPEKLRLDAERDAWLEAHGVKVLRFWNSQLRREKQFIRDTIWRILQERAPHPLPDYCRPGICRNNRPAPERSEAYAQPDSQIPPHPGPLPKGEGESSAAGRRKQGSLESRRRLPVAPSPQGESCLVARHGQSDLELQKPLPPPPEEASWVSRRRQKRSEFRTPAIAIPSPSGRRSG